MNTYERQQFWEKISKIRRDAKEHIQLHVDSLLEKHPHKKDLKNCLATTTDKDGLLVLLSLFGHSLSTNNKVLKSIDDDIQITFETIEKRHLEIERMQQQLMDQINSNHKSTFKALQKIYKQILGKRMLQKVMAKLRL